MNECPSTSRFPKTGRGGYFVFKLLAPGSQENFCQIVVEYKLQEQTSVTIHNKEYSLGVYMCIYTHKYIYVKVWQSHKTD